MAAYKAKVTVITKGKEYRPGAILPADISSADLKFLKEKADGGKLPTLQTLKAEKEKLLEEKKERQEKYYSYRDSQKELDTVCANIHAALGQRHTRPAPKQEREEIS